MSALENIGTSPSPFSLEQNPVLDEFNASLKSDLDEFNNGSIPVLDQFNNGSMPVLDEFSLRTDFEGTNQNSVNISFTNYTKI